MSTPFGTTRPSPAAVKAELAKYAFLRGLDAHSVDLSMLPAERRRFLATIGRRSTAQALSRREPEHRYPIVLALVSQCAVDVLDEVVQLFDQAVLATDHRAERKLEEKLAARAKASEDRLGLLDEVLSVGGRRRGPDSRPWAPGDSACAPGDSEGLLFPPAGVHPGSAGQYPLHRGPGRCWKR